MNLDQVPDAENKTVKVNYWSGFDVHLKKQLVFSVRGLKLTDKTRP